MPDAPQPEKTDSESTPQTKVLAIMGARLLNPQTPLGQKAQGFIGGAGFVYILTVAGASPDQIKSAVQSILYMLFGI